MNNRRLHCQSSFEAASDNYYFRGDEDDYIQMQEIEYCEGGQDAAGVASSGIASDHPMTAAVDLDLSKDGDLKAAHDRAESLYRMHAADLDISMGQGDRVIHFGVHSPMGHRRWRY